ncbi:AAA family ATPase [Hymenobacter sp. H14-R3]|uniref:AAA family ATPase n=1 Tax=Hymenobacter sp. H14-R3 TaxID=3046308 RepID=UPI0024B9441E|nr:AAA family ATPase [Hymenobacter sp. H14-R3]MDJ0367106.1 AAA family ATPase [Hymenobacter sp. H14-R3]
MATKRTPPSPPASAPARPPYMLIEEIRVQGYKSLVDATLHVRPLTLLAGTNSSGKSSIMQPLLLIKQTMEAPYLPASALVLNGEHLKAERAEDLLSRIDKAKEFSIKFTGLNIFGILPDQFTTSSFLQTTYQSEVNNFTLAHQTSNYVSGNNNKGILNIKLGDGLDVINNQLANILSPNSAFLSASRCEVIKTGSFLAINFYDAKNEPKGFYFPAHFLVESLANTIHIPGLRRGPDRNYLATYSTGQIKGTFDIYAAGTISQWQQENNTEALTQINTSLQRLGLTNAVTAKVKNANEVELSVNRLPSTSKIKPKKADMVNIADVGIGVSQVLPILVALIAAQEGQIVYIEQPELHLHPRAQVAMGELLAEAANRGVRVIVETHSSLLLLTIQTLIAQGKIANTDVGLHWFTRDAKGASQVQYVQPDEDGAYGDWPEDFSDIELKAQDAYLTAVGLRQFGEAAQ